MAIVIQCPHCQKKMKVKALPSGKKVRCPGCSKGFLPEVAAAGSAAAAPAKPKPTAARPKPKPKRQPKPVEDEFDDYGDDDFGSDDGFDDDYEEEAPRRSQPARKGGKKSAGRKPAGKKKAAGGSKSKAPLFIGIGVLAAALIGGAVYMFMSGGDDNSSVAGGTDSTGTDPANMPGYEGAMANNPDDASGGSPDPGGAGGHGAGGAAGHGAGGAGGHDAPSSPAAGTQPSAVAGNTPTVGSKNQVTQFLPANSEAVIKVDVQRLLNGPLGQLLQNPLVTQPIEEFRSKTGFGPEDLQSVTIGVAGISDAVSSGAPPQPEAMPATFVIRASQSVDAAKISAAIPNAQSISEGAISFIRIPEDPPVAIWLADSSTAVVGAEPFVKQVAAQSASGSSVDISLLDGTSTIQLAFSPSNPDAVFRNPAIKVPDNVPGAPAASLALARTFLQHGKSIGVNFDFTNDLGMNIAARCNDASGAQALSTAMAAAHEEGKAQAEAQAQNAPPMMAPFLQINKALSDSFKLETTSDVCRFTMSAPGAGQQIAAFAPMVIAPAIMQARNAARRVQSNNNLKQIALAMHNFHSVYRRFPNAAGKGPNGETWLSWRVHLLPFLGQEDLYKQFALEEPWDSPQNRPLADRIPDVFRSPNVDIATGKTLYQVPVGAGTMYEGTTGRGMRDCTDGTSNTILIVETSPSRAVYWTEPVDHTFDASNPLDGLGGVQGNAFQVALADGSGKMVSLTASPSSVAALFTRAGGEIIDQSIFTQPRQSAGPPPGFGADAEFGGSQTMRVETSSSEIVGVTESGVPQFEREWQDKDGNVLFKAKLMEFKDNQVTFLRSDNGETVVIPLENLSEAARDEIQFFADN